MTSSIATIFFTDVVDSTASCSVWATSDGWATGRLGSVVS